MDKNIIEERFQVYIKEVDKKYQIKLAQEKKKRLLEKYDEEDKIVPFIEIYNKVQAQPKLVPISTGWEELDKKLSGGLREGELVLVSGLTNHGKTSVLYDMTRNMEASNVMWLPYEESPVDLARKVMHWGRKPDNFFVPASMKSENMEWIEERVWESIVKYNTKVVILDNLHFITMTGADNNKQLPLTALMTKQLKQIAQKYQIVMVVITHLKKGEGQSKIPEIEQISGSSDIIKVADTVMCVWRENEKDKNTGKINYTGRTVIDVQKIRAAGGEFGATMYRFEKGSFYEVEYNSFLEEKMKEKKVSERISQLTSKMTIDL